MSGTSLKFGIGTDILLDLNLWGVKKTLCCIVIDVSAVQLVP